MHNANSAYAITHTGADEEVFANGIVEPDEDAEFVILAQHDGSSPTRIRIKKSKPITCKICGHQFRWEFREQRQIWHDQNMPCPKCGELYCVITSTERTLRKIQDKYHLTTNKREREKYLVELYSIMTDYASSMILKRHSNVVTTPEFLEQHSHTAASLVLEYYLKWEPFRITISFGGMLSRKIKESLWKKGEHPAGDISLHHVSDTSKKNEWEVPSICKNLTKSEVTTHADSLCNQLFRLIKEQGKNCSPAENLKRVIQVSIFLKNKQSGVDLYYKCFGNVAEDSFKSTIEALHREIHASLRNS